MLTLGLAAPFTPAPIGLTNLQGDVSMTIQVPNNLPVGGVDLFAPGVTLGQQFTPPTPPSFRFCASNVAGFHTGNRPTVRAVTRTRGGPSNWPA